MAIQSANIKIRTAWWLPLYLKAIVWTYAITGREPDWSKVERVVVRGMRCKIEPESVAIGWP